MRIEGRRFNELLRAVPGIGGFALRSRLAELTSAGLVEHGSIPSGGVVGLPSGQPGTKERRAYKAAYMRKRRGSRTSRSGVYRLTMTGLTYIEPLGLLVVLTGGVPPVPAANVIGLVEDLPVAEKLDLPETRNVAHVAQDMPGSGFEIAPPAAEASALAHVQVSEVVEAEPAQPSFDVMAAALDFRPQLLSRARALYNGDLPAAEDAVGDVFVKLCSKPPEPRTPAQLHHWLRTVLQRQWIDRHRKLTHRLVLVEKVVSLDVLNGWVG